MPIILKGVAKIMKITKAVIPAAGLGTRMLPATKSMPKEMYPIVDKPAIQFLVEEAVDAGITDILIITSRGKNIIEDHFDRSPELEYRLDKSGKHQVLDELKALSSLANISYIRQGEPLGLGHAISCAESFVAGEPFAVLYGDDVIMGDVSATKELCDLYKEHGLGVLGVKHIETEEIHKYGSVNRLKNEFTDFLVTDMIEKPSPEKMLSNYAILGRVVLPSEIFDILRNTPAGKGGEIQLTDAMKTLAETKGMIGCEYSGTRFDMGNKFGAVEAILTYALKNSDTSAQTSDLIKKIAKNL